MKSHLDISNQQVPFTSRVMMVPALVAILHGCGSDPNNLPPQRITITQDGDVTTDTAVISSDQFTPADGSSTDIPTMVVDGGRSDSSAVDVGMPVDTGSPTIDTGMVNPVDTGMPVSDVPVIPTDRGMVVEDRGMPVMDSGACSFVELSIAGGQPINLLSQMNRVSVVLTVNDGSLCTGEMMGNHNISFTLVSTSTDGGVASPAAQTVSWNRGAGNTFFTELNLTSLSSVDSTIMTVSADGRIQTRILVDRQPPNASLVDVFTLTSTGSAVFSMRLPIRGVTGSVVYLTNTSSSDTLLIPRGDISTACSDTIRCMPFSAGGAPRNQDCGLSHISPLPVALRRCDWSDRTFQVMQSTMSENVTMVGTDLLRVTGSAVDAAAIRAALRSRSESRFKTRVILSDEAGNTLVLERGDILAQGI